MSIDENMLNPFITSFINVTSQFGLSDIKKKDILLKEGLISNYSAVVVVGITGDIKGNVTYNMQLDTVKKLSSTMMMGMPVEEINEMVKSSICELTNMITGGSCTIFESELNKTLDISPPTMIMGKNLEAVISQVQTIAIIFDTPAGEIEINIGLEI